MFTTQEGYDMVSELYVQRQGEFGSAEHIIEKSLRNIKEETKWSAENLPVIEKWLDEYLKTANTSEKKFMGWAAAAMSAKRNKEKRKQEIII